MTKLLVLDKDGTLTRPKSGNTFVQYPEDQELIEGVAEAIVRYVADGWTLAIASNQGGCEVRSCHPADIPIGSYYVVDDVAIKCEYLEDTGEFILVNGHHQLVKTRLAKYRYKTIDDAIAEMRFALKLLPLANPVAQEMKAVFCPDDGNTMVVVTGLGCYPPRYWNKQDLEGSTDISYRKPSGGMLEYLTLQLPLFERVERKLMIGDRAEDQAAAQAAGFEFMWAHEWIALNS